MIMNSGFFIYYVIGMVLSSVLKSKFARYSQVALHNGLSGKEIAEKMLRENGINDVTVTSVEGHLTDHYNPANKTVNLSPEVYSGRSVAAAAVAAHECGHAVQHAVSYPMLRFRSAIVPVVQFASSAQQFLLILALGVLGATGGQTILLITIVAFFVTTVFSLVTLPVEFDASRRALAWLENKRMLNQEEQAIGSEQDGAKDALKWAAMTYVAAALSSMAMLIFLIMRYTNRN